MVSGHHLLRKARVSMKVVIEGSRDLAGKYVWRREVTHILTNFMQNTVSKSRMTKRRFQKTLTWFSPFPVAINAQSDSIKLRSRSSMYLTEPPFFTAKVDM